ncbi:MAG TPA: T9SS type A sorting domain-containing protein, partial [Rhodothermales bacterium]|nr:T9SS type A sorting domain-containing protein [Rhodothermales bacterium]
TATCTDAPAITDANTGYTATGDLTSTRYDLAVTPGTSVAWYARSRNSGGTQSAASTRHYFVVAGTTGGAAVTVTPSYPTGGATVYTLTPTLSWYLSGSSAGVTGYQVCFGTASTAAGNPSCASPASVSGATTTSYAVPSGQLSYSTTYYWFVRTQGGSTWSSASFVTTSGGGSSVPVASWPTGGATVWSSSATLSWYLTGSSAGITSYEGELTRLGDGGATTTFTATAPASSKSVTGLVGGASYSWRVKACAGATCSAFSTPGTFTVHSSVGGAPMPFAESPAMGVVITGTAAPVLSWSLPVEGLSALTYDVEISRAVDMASPQRFERLTSPQVALKSLAAGTHYWRVRSRDAQGNVSAYSPVERFTTTTSVASEEIAIPTEYALESIYPNPLTRAGTVRFGLPEAGRVRLALYDALGREVAVLADGELPAGVHGVALDAAALPSGLYVARLSAGRFTATRTMVISH